jgi:hypothetical protein
MRPGVRVKRARGGAFVFSVMRITTRGTDARKKAITADVRSAAVASLRGARNATKQSPPLVHAAEIASLRSQ